jgi:hypothetical protein
LWHLGVDLVNVEDPTLMRRWVLSQLHLQPADAAGEDDVGLSSVISQVANSKEQ